MSDDKPTPLEDVRKGLGLLFRAAKAAVQKLEARGGVEDVVVTSAREVGRAIENVASAIEREVLGRKGERDAPRADRPAEPTDPTDERKQEGSTKPKSDDRRD